MIGSQAKARARTPTPATPKNRAPTVHAMLQEIYELTAHVAEAVRVTSQPTPALQRHEVERIVRRTQQHYEGQIQSLEHEVAALKSELESCRQKKSGLSPRSADTLLRQLHAEKQQRLECEEQCQRMTEEHAKLVQTLETRIRKLERQAEGFSSVKGTPRSRVSVCGKVDEETEAAETKETEARLAPASLPPIATSTDAVNEFLSSIGKELDAINALETQRSKQLRALL